MDFQETDCKSVRCFSRVPFVTHTNKGQMSHLFCFCKSGILESFLFLNLNMHARLEAVGGSGLWELFGDVRAS